jgi:hypothetical protein
MRLKITLTVFLIIILAASKTNAQVTAYTFTLGSGTYQALSNPTSINNGQVWTNTSLYGLPLGFNFPLASGRSTNTIGISSGSLDFGQGSPAYLLTIFQWNLGNMLTDKGFGTGTSSSPISYEISGTTGNRIAKIEFQNAGFDYDYQSSCSNPTGADYVNFQYWLYEASGKIEVHFGPNSVMNPHSYDCSTNFGGSFAGPYVNFFVDNSLVNLYANASNPTVGYYNPPGNNSNSMNATTASNGTIYTFNLDPGYISPALPQCAYTFALGSGTYQALSNPTSVNNGQVWTSSFSSPYTLPLGFNFPLTSGRVTNSVEIYGGSLRFMNSSPYFLLIYHWPFGGNMLTDRGFGTSTSLSPISYEITGSVGNRIVKIEFQNAGMDHDYQSFCTNPTGADYVNFQYWLHEATGKVEVHFGPSSVANPNSYNCNPGNTAGPFMKFLVDNCFLNPSFNATNPLVTNWDNTGIVYGNPMNGSTAASGTIYIFNPDPTYAVSLSTILDQEQTSVFPNPVTDVLTIGGNIDAGNAAYEIVNALGQTVLKGSMEKQVNVSSLAPGMYSIRLQGLGAKKFIKE